VTTTLRQPVLAFTAAGKLLKVNAADVPEVGGRSRGKAVGEAFAADKGDSIIFIAGLTGEPVVVVTAGGMAKRLDRQALADLRPTKPVIKLATGDRVVAAFAVAEDEEIVFVTSDAQALRTPVSTISVQGPAAKGVAGIKLKGKARVVGAGPAEANAVVVSVTDSGSAKATSVQEIPSKGRGTGGVRITRFKDETRIDFAWVGSPERTMCVVGQTDSATKPDNAPQPLKLRATRRDGVSSRTERRILGIGSLRW